jgi:hypothetical protein
MVAVMSVEINTPVPDVPVVDVLTALVLAVVYTGELPRPHEPPTRPWSSSFNTQPSRFPVPLKE